MSLSILSGLVGSPSAEQGPGKGKSSVSKSSERSTLAIQPSSIAETSPNPVTHAAISTEYSSLRYSKHCPSGMYITPTADNIFVWDAVLFIHKGYYAGSVLKFTMSFPDKYPDKPPTVRFLTDVFHPLVETQTGLLNLMARFRPWRPKEHRLHDILHFVKAMFKGQALERINELDVVNKEAFK
ncbi:hypothetical protein ID866_2486 [Astraeus odoratus]|nr:hypothetical protein ID866_2486 [Astraeus odoratus]